MGLTYSSNFPTTPGALQTTFGGGNSEAFVANLNATGTGLLYSTYLGGSGNDDGNGIAVDSSGNAYVTGTTASTNFPTTPGALQTTPGSGFVAKLNTTGTAFLYSTFLVGGSYGIAVDSSGNAYITGAAGSNFSTTPRAVQTGYGGWASCAFVVQTEY